MNTDEGLIYYAMANKKEDIELLHEYGIYPRKRLVRLFTDIDEGSTMQTCDNLMALDQTDGPITLLLNTPGGEWYNGLAIYDTIKSSKNHITIIGLGHVMSMGTVIMQAADERLVSANCRLMVHYGTDGFIGNSKDMVEAGKETAFAQKKQEDIYLSRIHDKKPQYRRADLKKLLSVDTYLTPDEFVRLGLADKVVGDE